MKTMMITVALAVLIGSAHAQEDPVHQLFYKAYNEFGKRYRVSAAALACDRKGIAEAVMPEQEELLKYLMTEFLMTDPDDRTEMEIADVMAATGYKLDGYYLGHVEALQIVLSVYSEEFTANYCEEMLKIADGLLTE